MTAPLHNGNIYNRSETVSWTDTFYGHIDGLQHKGTMSTKPIFQKIAKITKVVFPNVWTCNTCAFDTGRTMTVIDKITIFCNDVNKTSTSVKLLTINIMRYVS